MWNLLGTLKPGWWFSAHLHVRFQAKVVWDEEASAATAQGSTVQEPVKEVVANPDEIQIDDFDGTEEAPMANTSGPSSSVVNPDEISIDDDDSSGTHEANPPPAAPAPADPNVSVSNPEEINLDDVDNTGQDEAEVAAFLDTLPEPKVKEWGDGKGWPDTKFLALDKCLPRRQFLEVSPRPISAQCLTITSNKDSRRP